MTRYTHACPDCTPLGKHEQYDLYLCAKYPRRVVKARYGDRPYQFHEIRVPTLSRLLHAALTRALEQNLLP